MSDIFDVVIIGSGPAGLTAGVYTSRGNATTLLLGGSKWGGQLMFTSTVDNFPGFPEGVMGPDLMVRLKDQAVRFGVDFRPLDVTGVNFQKSPFEITAGSETFLGKTVIVATGAETVWLDAPGVSQFIGRGISSCAPCDAPFFRDKKVAVVGGGDSAMEEALYLTKYAKEVFVIHRRDTFRASKIMIDKVLNNPKIKVMWNTEILGVSGQETVNGLKLKNNKTQNIKEEAFDGLFVAIGHKPMSDLFKGRLETDEKGFLLPKQKVPGVFIAGDVHDRIYKQAVTAAGFGCMAAMDALTFLG